MCFNRHPICVVLFHLFFSNILSFQKESRARQPVVLTHRLFASPLPAGPCSGKLSSTAQEYLSWVDWRADIQFSMCCAWFSCRLTLRAEHIKKAHFWPGNKISGFWPKNGLFEPIFGVKIPKTRIKSRFLNRKFYFRFELIFFSKITAFLHEMPIIMAKKQKTPLRDVF